MKKVFSFLVFLVVAVGFYAFWQAAPAQAVAVGDRVQATSNVNVRGEPNGYVLGTQYKDVLYSGFRQYAPAKGVVVAGPQSAGGYTWMKINYDYGADGWSAVDYLSSLGQVVGWEFTPDNVLGRKLQPASGAVLTETYYYYVEDGQVSIPSNSAQASLPPEAIAVLANIQGGWSCVAITNYPPFRVVGYQCSYRRGNLSPVIESFTGAAIAMTNTVGSWQFRATDPEGALASYQVDWGDGSVTGGGSLSGATVTENVSHTYTRVGTFNIKLTVTDVAGLSVEAALLVEVTAPCSVKFQAGGRVKVINVGAENPLNVRSSPVVPANRDSNKLGGHYAGDLGTILDGSQSGSGYCWWNINYDAAPDGWSAEGDSATGLAWLEAVAGGGTFSQDPQPTPYNPPSFENPSGIYPAGASTNLAVGDYVRTTYFVNVRATPNGQIASTQFIGAVGRLIDGPYLVGGLNWWNIDYTSPPDGWSEETDSTGRAFLVKTNPPRTYDPFTPPTSLPPVLSPITGVASVNANMAGTWQISATDNDSLSLTYTVNWGDGTSNTYTGTSGQAVSITHTYVAAGTPTISVTVSDGTMSDAESLAISVTAVGQNQAPILDPIPTPTQATVGANTLWEMRATDPEGSALTYTINWGDDTPNSTYTGMSGQVVSISHTYATAGSKMASVTVSDGTLSTSGSFTVAVTAAQAVNQPPIISNFSGPSSIVENTSGSWQVLATDVNGDSLIYSIDWGDNSQLSVQTGVGGVAKTFTHTYAATSQRTATVTITDGKGGSVNQSLSVQVVSSLGFRAGERVKVKPGTQRLAIRSEPSLSGTWLGSVDWGRIITIDVGAYAPLYSHPELPPKGGAASNPQLYRNLSPLQLNGRVWEWRGASGLWQLTVGPAVTVYVGYGEVLEGPISASGYVWWKIKWDEGFEGWSAENWLEKAF